MSVAFSVAGYCSGYLDGNGDGVDDYWWTVTPDYHNSTSYIPGCGYEYEGGYTYTAATAGKYMLQGKKTAGWVSFFTRTLAQNQSHEWIYCDTACSQYYQFRMVRVTTIDDFDDIELYDDQNSLIQTVNDSDTIDVVVAPDSQTQMIVCDSSGSQINGSLLRWKVVTPSSSIAYFTGSYINYASIIALGGPGQYLICVGIGDSFSICFTVNLFKVELEEVSFLGGNYPITRQSDSTVMSSSQWLDLNHDGDVLDSSEHGYPVAYKKGATPTLSAIIKATSSVAGKTIKVRGIGIGFVIDETTASVSGSTITLNPTMANGAFDSSSVRSYSNGSYIITWGVKIGSSSWYNVGKSRNTLYLTYDTPPTIKFENAYGGGFTELYDTALAYACGYANGQSSASSVISNVNSGVASDVGYNAYASPYLITTNPIVAYDDTDGIVCLDGAFLVKGLLASVGISSEVKFIFGGTGTSNRSMFQYSSSTSNLATFYVIKPATDSTPANPHFTYHAAVQYGSTLYDPSYGTSYTSLGLSEVANGGCSEQHSGSLPSPSWNSVDKCTHAP